MVPVARSEKRGFRENVAECRLRRDAKSGELTLTCRGEGMQRILDALPTPVQAAMAAVEAAKAETPATTPDDDD